MNDEGIPRQWTKIETDQILKLFNNFKKQNLKAFDIFKEFKLLKNPLKCIYNYLYTVKIRF